MSTRAGKTLIHQLPTVALGGHYRFIASQGDTAPKQVDSMAASLSSFIASQGDTAPKQPPSIQRRKSGFITSQGDTAPKRA